MKKKRAVAVTATFLILIFALAALFLLPDAKLSCSERRKLTQIPEFSADAIISGEYAQDFESYLLDQFPFRDRFRTVKSVLSFYIFGQADNNEVYIFGDGAFKMDYPLDEKQIDYAAAKLNSLNEALLKNSRVYYSIIPDKNYFAAEDTGHPHIDYDKLVLLLSEQLSGMEYINIFPYLSIEDYYRTDAHWKQESIYPVAQALAAAMDASDRLSPLSSYAEETLYPFYGVYYGQSALPLKPDTIRYLTNSLTESALVTGPEFTDTRAVYNTQAFSGMDGYDVFLSGAQAVVEISCPQAESDRELIIFRDSFASGIAPYFIGAYSKITLVDLRYISSSVLQNYIDFHGQDVLFLYSTSLLNSAMLLK